MIDGSIRFPQSNASVVRFGGIFHAVARGWGYTNVYSDPIDMCTHDYISSKDIRSYLPSWPFNRHMQASAEKGIVGFIAAKLSDVALWATTREYCEASRYILRPEMVKIGAGRHQWRRAYLTSSSFSLDRGESHVNRQSSRTGAAQSWLRGGFARKLSRVFFPIIEKSYVRRDSGVTFSLN